MVSSRRPVFVHHDVGDPAHQVLAEADLGVHPTGRGENGAGGEVTEMPGDGRRADVEGHAEGQVAETGPDPDHFPLVADRHRHRPLPASEGRLQPVQDRWVDREPAKAPLIGECRQQTLEIAGGAGQVGLGDFDVMQTDHRIHGKGRHPGPLSDHLAVDLAVRRDIDHDVVGDVSGAPEPLSSEERPLSPVVGLGGTRCRQSVGSGLDPGPAPDHHLAPATDPTTTADGVEVHAELPRRVEDGGPVGERPPSPRRGEGHLPGHPGFSRVGGGCHGGGLRLREPVAGDRSGSR